MEGVGPRLGRASSRYGPAATVFNGPVRRWKKKWVHVSSSPPVSYQSQSNGQNNDSTRLLLRRWTPLPPTTSSASSAAAGDDTGCPSPEEPPRRKFRYTPVAVIEDQQKKVEEKKVEDEAKTSETHARPALAPATAMPTPPTMSDEDEQHVKPNVSDDFKEEDEDSNISNLDLGLGLKGPNDNLDTIGDMKESPTKKESSSRLWSMVRPKASP